MSKYRICYSQGEEVKFISHLDFLRTIGRSLRRAGLPVKYSEGFNPHVCLSFASALGVGVSSECEMFTVILLDAFDTEEIKERLNDALPPSIRAIKVIEGEVDFGKIAYADYEIISENEISEDDVNKFMSLPEILMDKKTKRGIKETDIKEDIYSISGNNKVYKATLKTGNDRNLKPMLLVDALNKYLSTDLGFCRYRRICFRDAEQNIL